RAYAPGQAFAKIQVVAVMQCGGGQQASGRVDRLPAQLVGQAIVADFARRILHRRAGLANLKLEAAPGGCSGQAVSAPSAAGRRMGRPLGARDGILLAWFAQWL